MHGGKGLRTVCRKGWMPRQRLEEHHPHGIEIAPRARRGSGQDLGRLVARRAGTGHTDVGQLRGARGPIHQDVLGLHVAVNQPRGVDGGEPGERTGEHPQGLLGRERSGVGQQLAQGGPLHQLGDEPGSLIVLAVVEQAHHVRVGELLENGNLGGEVGTSTSSSNPLHRDRGAGGDGQRPVDRPGGPLAEETLQAVADREGHGSGRR